MTRCRSDFALALKGAAIVAPFICARVVARGEPADLATTCGFVLLLKRSSCRKYRAKRQAQRLVDSDKTSYAQWARSIHTRVRRAPLQRPTTDCRAPAIERIVD
jgi:hypothetical protein